MLALRVRATHVCIDAVEPVNEPGIQQKIKCSIYGIWRRAPIFVVHEPQDVVGPDWPVSRPDEFQKPSSQLRKAHTALRTYGFRLVQRLTDATAVIMPRGGEVTDYTRCSHMHTDDTRPMAGYYIVQ